jgi:uncharacterized membrane protein YeaQ/YmgE (transglycosylase-associated protein family)
MTLESILIACGIGIIAGWLASLVMRGAGSGLLREMIIGVLGGVIGHWLIPKMGITLPGGPYVTAILTAFIGAVVLLLGIRLIGK